jgi:hypothetical protein
LGVVNGFCLFVVVKNPLAQQQVTVGMGWILLFWVGLSRFWTVFGLFWVGLVCGRCCFALFILRADS